MHPAGAFRVEDPARLTAWITGHPFAVIAASAQGALRIAQAPVLVRELDGALALDFHLSRRNALAPAIAQGFRGVILFQGADAYVSPDWYVAPDQVPTWNYVAVEAEGEVVALGHDGLVRMLDDLSAQEEARLWPKAPWTRAKMGSGRFEAMLAGIVGARLTVERLEGTFKLSQNKGAADVAGVAEALGDHPVAKLMRGRT